MKDTSKNAILKEAKKNEENFTVFQNHIYENKNKKKKKTLQEIRKKVKQKKKKNNNKFF